MTLRQAVDGVTRIDQEQKFMLREAFNDIAKSHDDIDTTKLGNWINKHKDRVIDGLKLVEAGSYRHAKK